jgi:hypothetical protein
LAEEDSIVLDHETLRLWMFARRAVEPAAEGQETLPAKGAQIALRDMNRVVACGSQTLGNQR